jgi:hypothetical protein
VSSCELFPQYIPDLFCGQPLLVVGKYEGTWPEEAQLRGLLPTGEGAAPARGAGGLALSSALHIALPVLLRLPWCHAFTLTSDPIPPT